MELFVANSKVLAMLAAVLLLELISAPLELIPEPLMVRAFNTAWPLRSNTAPLLTVTVPVPKAPFVMELMVPVDEAPSVRVPTATVVSPV